jgi:RimJ/RimL family protein N-acetyltransferase
MNVLFRSLCQGDMPVVCELIPMNVTSDTSGIVAYDERTDKLLAVFVAQDWTATSVQAHQVILSPMVLRHGFFEECANYIFTKAARLKMYGIVPSNNEKAISVNEKVGFEELIRLKDACDVGVDYVLMELKRENCPYWKPVNEMAA